MGKDIGTVPRFCTLFEEIRVLISFKCVSGPCLCTEDENRLIYVYLMLKTSLSKKAKKYTIPSKLTLSEQRGTMFVR